MTMTRRFQGGDPLVEGQDVVLASDYDRLAAQLEASEALCGQWMGISTGHERDADELGRQVHALRKQLTLLDSESPLDERMKAAGMMSTAELLAGAPLDGFIRHAGVHDLPSFAKWLVMRRTEYINLHARFTLDKREGDELFGWIAAHMSVFTETMVNLRAAAPEHLPPALSNDP